MARESSEDNAESPQFSHNGPHARRMMEKMGYDLTKRFGLSFGKERRTLLRSFVPKGKAPDYYLQTRRGLGYVSTLVSSDLEYEKWDHHDHSSKTSSWESDVSTGAIFKSLLVT